MINSTLSRNAMIAILIASNVACTTLTGEIEQVDATTANLTADVKSALVTDMGVDAAAILVAIRDDGSVVLSGFVESEEERQAAMTSAQTAASAVTVVDQLELR